jgi:hypothetical protein
LGIISQNISILRSLILGAVDPFLSGSSAFVACAISYNRLGFSRKPYRALAPNPVVLKLPRGKTQRKNYREKVFGYRENIFKLFCFYLLSMFIEKKQFNYRKTLSLKKATTGQKV